MLSPLERNIPHNSLRSSTSKPHFVLPLSNQQPLCGGGRGFRDLHCFCILNIDISPSAVWVRHGFFYGWQQKSVLSHEAGLWRCFYDSWNQIRSDPYCHAGVGVIASVKEPKVTPSDSSGSFMGTLAGFRDYFMLTTLKLSLENHTYVLTLVPYLVTSANLF